jgi:membrane protease YdiL (CAAX protease family)
VSERSGGRLTGWATVVGILAALGYASRFSDQKTPKDVLYHWDTFVGGLIQFLLLLGLMLAVAWGLPKRETFALRWPRSWRQAFGIMLAVAVVVVGVSAILEPVLHPDKEQGLAPTRWEPAHAGAFFANFAVVALLAPVVEELTFRGLGFTLLERFGRPAAIVLVSLAFGLAHGLVEGLPLLFLFGAGLAYLRSRTRSVYPGMVVHVLYNGLVLLIAVKFFHTGALRIPF